MITPPECSDGFDTTRRQFFTWVATILSAMVGLVLAVPLLGSLIGTAWRTKKRHFAKVAEVAALPAGQPVDLTFADPNADAYLRETVMRSVWVVKRSATGVVVYSPICPHLGCQYTWDTTNQHFHCPCHNSVFALNGQVLSGPAPRPLDTLPVRIEQGELFVEWQRFKLGIPRKVSV
jgi:menaquinol-cytochrome c reductase iron-sulfur subunit